MKTVQVTSYAELESLVSQTERSFLLLYKGGSEQSECALDRIRRVKPIEESSLFLVDVTQVRDIHKRLSVDTAPSLVVFRQDRILNVIKGCQTEESYDSILAGREQGASRTEGTKKVQQVTVYTTPTCSWCTTLKSYLDNHNVIYREVNVATDTSAAEAIVKKSGQQGVPQTEINGQMVVGFDKPRINQLLAIE